MFSNVFDYDNAFWRFMGKLGDLIILNILWVICSLPIITVGASTTAVYYVVLKLVKDEEGATVKSFFKSFKENFKQATAIWIILLIGGIVLAFDWRFVYSLAFQSSLKMILLAAFGCLSLIYLSVMIYIFPIQARFYNSIKRTFINACFMSVKHFPKTFVMLVTNVGLVLACTLLMPRLFIVIILFGLPLFAFLNSFLLVGIFESYMAKVEETSPAE